MLNREATFPRFGLRTSSSPPTGLSKNAALSLAPFLRISLGALLVAAAYYAGSELGFFLKPADTAIATFWPPSAILLAAFLLVPTRMWWVFLLAVLPAHLFVQLQGGTTLPAALGWYIANTCGPLLGAVCIRHSKKEKTLFDSLQGIIVFLMFGVLLPPLVKSFLIALATLQTGAESNYWMLWTTRLSSNITSDLILIPLVVIFWRNGVSWFRSAKLGRCIEASVLLAATVGISLLIFSGGSAAGSIPAVIYAPLSLLFWAALRFGPGGLSASLLGVALISIWNTIHGRGPFGTYQIADDILIHRILFLQGLLMVFGFPLMSMAALITERRCNQETLRDTRSKLIHVQEQEYYRIGRALYEDIAQRLTLVSLGIDALRAGPDASAKPPLNRLHGQISEAVATALDLSHRIHPFMVEYLGLTAALRKLCRETGTTSGMTVNCSIEALPTDLPSDVSHRLFRVAQEALQDIVQHSRAETVAVELRVGDGQLLLRITYDGVGMDPLQGEDIGLAYMREQALSLDGTFKIMSTPKGGTVIEASAPVKASPGASA